MCCSGISSLTISSINMPPCIYHCPASAIRPRSRSCRSRPSFSVLCVAALLSGLRSIALLPTQLCLNLLDEHVAYLVGAVPVNVPLVLRKFPSLAQTLLASRYGLGDTLFI